MTTLIVSKSFRRLTNYGILLNRRRFYEGLPNLVSAVESGMHVIKSMSGLPWWITFASSTVFVRMAIFPIVSLQLVESRKLTNAMPELGFLYQLLKLRLAGTSIIKTVEIRKIVRTFFKGVRASLVLHNVSLSMIISYPLLNIGILFSFIYSLRAMLKSKANYTEMSEGGPSWNPNLTSRDVTYVLPLTAIALSYLSIELALLGAGGRLALAVKDIFQTLVIISTPFVSGLPSGIFYYWIPSSLIGIAQTLALRSTWIQRLLRVPAVQKPKHLQGNTTFEKGI